jgi:hypothetical protein
MSGLLMSLLFESPNWVFSCLLVVIPAILFALAVLWLVRKIISYRTLRQHHDVAGFTFSIVGVLYSVILGFTVISVQSRYNHTEETIHTEVTMLSDLYRDADYLPPDNRAPIRSALRKYVDYVIHVEWKSPGSKRSRLGSQIILRELWNSYYSVELQEAKVRIWYEQMISKLDQLMNARLARQFSAKEHLGGMMWSLLIIGAMITVGFMFFFGLENMRSQMLMTALLAGYLSFMLYAVFSLDHVFKGPNAIQPVAFEQVLLTFDQWDLTIQYRSLGLLSD